MKKIIPFLFLCLALIGCEKKEIADTGYQPVENPLFTKLGPEQTGINFVNHIESSTALNVFKYRNFYNGGGVGIGDLNNDGLADVYLTSNMSGNKLYLNKGNFSFEDITDSAGVSGKNEWSTGVVMVDINADGLLDIYVCNAGNVEGDNQKNELYINNGDLTFTEKAEEMGLADSGFTTHAAFFDYDGDGDLDVYILNNSFISVESLGYNNKREVRAEEWPIADFMRGGGDKMLRNDNGIFRDVSKEAGIYGSLIGFGLGVNVGDVNLDGWYDIYVSNDFYEQDYLYINQKNGTFKEESRDYFPHMSFFSMGADIADINNDGFQEIFTTDMLPENDTRLKEVSTFESYDLRRFQEEQNLYNQYMHNNLHLNNQNGTYSEIGFLSGVARTDWSWGALMFDMDNDGYRDIFVCNGILHDLTNQDFMNFFANEIIQNQIIYGKKEAVDSIIHKMPSVAVPNYAFKNNGNLKFENATREWGLDEPAFSNGSAYGDLDNDGDLDLIVNNVNSPLFVYRNESVQQLKNHFIKVILKGKAPNTFGLGAKVKVFSGGEVHYTEQLPARGFQSSVEPVITVGLGSKSTVDSLQVIWPGGAFQTLYKPEPDRDYTFQEENASGKYNYNKERTVPSLFTKTSNRFMPHKENNYIDYDYEGLIAKMLSKEGPAGSVADVNRDGLDDIFIGGATGQSGMIYLQNPNGTFAPLPGEALAADSYFEDTAAAFADLNGDGYPDLVVGSGGNEAPKSEQWYNTRVYLNRQGSFNTASTKISYDKHNTSVIAPYDFDEDGDTDLFIGSRSIPGLYGPNPENLLLENDGKGNFTNVTDRKAYDIKNIGLITDALWEDIDGDGRKDLIVTGDWMGTHLFKNNGKRLAPMPGNLESQTGWWKSVKAADFNQDGLPDLVLGNFGLNAPYLGSKDKPLKIYIHDFDNNGTIEQVMTYQEDGKEKPVNLRNDLANQIPDVKKENLIYSEYAQKGIDEVFKPELLKNAIVKEVNTMQTTVAINKGNGQFELMPLPLAVQFSPVNDILVTDLNGDQIPDLVLGGNQIENRPQYGRQDASYGEALLGKGDGSFERVLPETSGLTIKGMLRKWLLVNNQWVIALINNQEPVAFKINH